LAPCSLFHRARPARGRAGLAWLTTAGVTTGCGIWATHFMAMLAYEPGIPVAYNVGLTLLSLMVAAVVTCIGFAVALAIPGLWAVLVGGVVVGAGVGVMHYTGMWAVEVPGYIAWELPLVVASVVLGMVFGAAALASAVRSDEIRTTPDRRPAADARDRLPPLYCDGCGRDGARPHARHRCVLAFADGAGAGDRQCCGRSAGHESGRRVCRSAPARQRRTAHGGPEQHGAGPCHVRSAEAADPVQFALSRDVCTIAGDREARMHERRASSSSERSRKSFRGR